MENARVSGNASKTARLAVEIVLFVVTIIFAGTLLANLVLQTIPSQTAEWINICVSIACLIVLTIFKPKFGRVRTCIGLALSVIGLVLVVFNIIPIWLVLIHSVVNATTAIGFAIKQDGER